MKSQAADHFEKRCTVTRFPVQQVKIGPKEIVEIAPGHYFIDFGKVAFGGLEFEINNSTGGQSMVVHLGEALSAPHTVHRKPGGSIRYHVTEVALESGRRTYRVALTERDARLMAPELGPVMPFRYVEIENAPLALTSENVRQLAAFYPFDDEAGVFECSDPKLNAIWDLCKYTMKATSFGGIFVDGDRERLPYEADAYINQLGWYYCAGDLTLPRYTHEYLILHPTWPTEWILFSVLIAWEDYQYSGDTESLAEFYEDLKAKTLIALERPDGLISTVEPAFPESVGEAIHIASIRDIVDWPLVERDGYELTAVNTVVNAFHCYALRRMENLAEVLGKPADAAIFRTAAGKVLQSLNAKLVDPTSGLYVDGEGSNHSSLHANMFPLAFGLVPQERVDRVTAFVKSKGMACSVYGAQFLMDALFDHGEATYAMALMTADTDRSWTHMVERVGTTIALEAWDNKYKPNQDWNHAWGAAPANIFPRKVLGIEPLQPGFSRIRIRPQLGNLSWAQGRVPTKHGPVSVRYEKDASELRLTVEIPPHTTARLELPSGGRVLLNGKPVQGVSAEGAVILDEVGPGRQSVVISVD